MQSEDRCNACRLDPTEPHSPFVKEAEFSDQSWRCVTPAGIRLTALSYGTRGSVARCCWHVTLLHEYPRPA